MKKINLKILLVVVAMASVLQGGCGMQETGGKADCVKVEESKADTEEGKTDVEESKVDEESKADAEESKTDAKGTIEQETEPKILVLEKKHIMYNSNGDIDISVESEYDEFGCATKIIGYNSDGRIRSQDEFEYEYDQYNNVTKCIRHVIVSNPFDYFQLSWYEVEYDEFNNVTKVINYYSDGRICSEEKFDTAGNMIEYYTNGILETKKEYDAVGNCTKIEDRYSGMEYEYEYDERGNLIKEMAYDVVEGTKTIKGGSEYVNDEYGNPIKVMHLDSDGSTYEIVEIEYEYDADGRIISMKNSTGYTELYEYDMSGNQTVHITYNTSSDVYQQREVWEYDTNGNMTTYTEYRDGGIVTKYIEYIAIEVHQ